MHPFASDEIRYETKAVNECQQHAKLHVFWHKNLIFSDSYASGPPIAPSQTHHPVDDPAARLVTLLGSSIFVLRSATIRRHCWVYTHLVITICHAYKKFVTSVVSPIVGLKGTLRRRLSYGYLWSPYVIGQTIYIFILFLSSSFFSSPNLSSRRLDVYHTSTHGVVLV